MSQPGPQIMRDSPTNYVLLFVFTLAATRSSKRHTSALRRLASWASYACSTPREPYCIYNRVSSPLGAVSASGLRDHVPGGARSHALRLPDEVRLHRAHAVLLRGKLVPSWCLNLPLKSHEKPRFGLCAVDCQHVWGESNWALQAGEPIPCVWSVQGTGLGLCGFRRPPLLRQVG